MGEFKQRSRLSDVRLMLYKAEHCSFNMPLRYQTELNLPHADTTKALVRCL